MAGWVGERMARYCIQKKIGESENREGDAR